MLFCGTHCYVPLTACMCQARDEWLFLWVTGHMSNGQQHYTAEQGNHTRPAGSILSHRHTMSCAFYLLCACGWLAKLGSHCLFFACPLSPNHAHRHHVLACFAHGAQLWLPAWGQRTRTMASECTLIISSHRSTSHADKVQLRQISINVDHL